ncbi:MAG: hypothetical protein KatS3mg110_4371 [Pirellulaceae bacterium]|nr:MAG: hypothetical protein KatS3mg110_4371 [Pirellulaceae bacterium]
MVGRVSERFRKHQRLRKQAEFDRVFAEGRVVSDATLVITGCRNQLGWSRLGVVVPRQVGSAVVRNRWKRWIREAFRRQQMRIPAGLDLVVRPRKGAAGNYHRIASSLVSLTRQLAHRLERSDPAASQGGASGTAGGHPPDEKQGAPCGSGRTGSGQEQRRP